MKSSQYLLYAKMTQEAAGYPSNPTLQESYSQLFPLQQSLDEINGIIDLLHQYPELISQLQMGGQEAHQ